MNENKTELLHADLTYTIRGALFHVGNNLWPGLPEEDVQKAVSIALTKRKILLRQKKNITSTTEM